MTPPNQDQPDVVEIRRYSNRRFYDSSQSRHVTLEEIRNIVQAGRDVRITDATTGEDITSRTLTQIILDYDDGKIAAFPSMVLHRLIRSSESLMLGMIGKSFENATRVFHDSQRSAGVGWERVAHLTPGPQEAARWWQETLGAAAAPGGSPGDAREGPPPAERESPGDLKVLVDELRGQLETMREELRTLQEHAGRETSEGPPPPDEAP